MKRAILLFLVLCNLFALVPALPAAAAGATQGYAFTDKVVLAYYYIWFNENRFLKGIADGMPEENIKGLHPLVGAYNSWEPAIIEKHMQQMNRALIDALAVSWWYDEKPNDMNQTLDTVYEKAVAHNLKITIDYEHGRRPLDQVYRDLRYFLTRYQNHPAMLKVEGMPVVMIWTAWGHTPEEWKGIFNRLEQEEGIKAFPIMSGSYMGGKGEEYLDPFRALEEYTLVDVEDCLLADYMKTMRGHIDHYNETRGRANGKLAQHHATISPGYDESQQEGRKTKNGGVNGAGWKDRGKFGVAYPDDPAGAYYRGTFEAAMQSNPDWLHISTFNELAEFSHIEATFEHGYTYIDLTAEFVKKFKGQK
ncbi:MAG: hypothetical protein RBU21_17765 [FCB group bacterium]|jgi:hypothetical protein|nr:hypothetical protein [FCB group bacterium]